MKKFNIKFYQHRKIYILISLAIFAVGLLFNLIGGVELDINFRGGALVQYSYTGEVDQETVEEAVETAIGKSVEVTITDGIGGTESGSVNTLNVSLSGSDGISLDEQKAIASELSKAYPDSEFEVIQSSSVPPTMGAKFFAKCLVAVALAAVLLVIYVALRFRKIGGMSAGVMAVVALLHDVLMVYFTFVIFRFPIDDNFIAVVLTILGYSLNNTIVVYDRVRENKKKLGPKVSYEDLMNLSLNQTLGRTLLTSVTTFLALVVVLVVALIFNISTVVTFALPMMAGVGAGCFSSECIAPNLFAMWQIHKRQQMDAAKGGKN